MLTKIHRWLRRVIRSEVVKAPRWTGEPEPYPLEFHAFLKYCAPRSKYETRLLYEEWKEGRRVE